MKEVFIIKVIPQGENEQLNKQYFLFITNYSTFKFGTDLCPNIVKVTDIYEGTLFSSKDIAENLLERSLGVLDKECLYKIESLYVYNAALNYSIKD